MVFLYLNLSQEYIYKNLYYKTPLLVLHFGVHFGLMLVLF